MLNDCGIPQLLLIRIHKGVFLYTESPDNQKLCSWHRILLIVEYTYKIDYRHCIYFVKGKRRCSILMLDTWPYHFGATTLRLFFMQKILASTPPFNTKMHVETCTSTL